MEPGRYPSKTFGTVQRQPGKTWSFYYYLPAQLPRELDLSPAVVTLLSEADASLGQLQGLCKLIRDPEPRVDRFTQ